MYRSAMRAVGDPIYRAALAEGDPIGFALAAGALRKIGGSAISKLARKAGGLVRRVLKKPAIRTTAGIATTTLATAAGTRLATGGKAAVEAGMGKRKRMNVVNPRALRRAIRRVSGFGKIVRRMKREVGRAATAVGVRRATAKKPFARKR